MFVHTLYTWLADCLFPIHCLGCGQTGAWLCRQCHHAIQLTPRPIPVDVPLDGVFALTTYDQPIIHALIHTAKYNGIGAIADTIGSIMTEALLRIDKSAASRILHVPETSIVPVPLHRRRFCERGFNQSERIARLVATAFAMPLMSQALKRARYTGQQAQMNRAERWKNMEEAFTIGVDFKKTLKNVILIDDVATTTATLAACATVLKRHGVHRVWGLVLAHGNS